MCIIILHNSLDWYDQKGLEIHLSENRILLLRLLKEHPQQFSLLAQLIQKEWRTGLIDAICLKSHQHIP